MEVRPHRGVGPFRIGSFIGEIIKFVQLHGMSFRDNAITTCIETPLSHDICVDLKDCGFRLRFDARSQRLHLIDVYDLSKTELYYNGKSLTGASANPTFRWIYDVFGPTYPGTYNQNKQVYLLQYPGVCILFPLTPALQSSLGSGFPPELPQPASRILIHHGPTVLSLSLRSLPGNLEPTCVFVKQGILLPKRNVFIGFDTSTQACLSDLGPPQQVFPKRENQMKIHSSAPDDEHQAPAKDYFFNYFLLGVDLLFDGRVHKVKSIILHTNSCASRQFTYYRKCNFRIFLTDHLDSSKLKATTTLLEEKGRSLQDGIDQTKTQPSEGIFQTLRRSSEEVKDRQQKHPRKPSADVSIAAEGANADDPDDEDEEFKLWGKGPMVGPDTPWDAIKSLKGECGRPMLHNKGDNTPFGSTQFFAYEGLIFEVMSNGYLDTVTLFCTN